MECVRSPSKFECYFKLKIKLEKKVHAAASTTTTEKYFPPTPSSPQEIVHTSKVYR